MLNVSRRRLRCSVTLLLMVAVPLVAPSCGSGSGGGGDEVGQGLVLMNPYQAGQDNVPINRVLRMRFSEAVDADTITPGSIQIRQGTAFGLTAKGSFRIDGADVYFEPRLPRLCGSSDAGFLPGTTYRVSVLGYPEQFCVRNVHGQPLEATVTYEFGTRPEQDAEFLEDQIPGVPPEVLSVTPAESEAGVTVQRGNLVSIVFSENIDPCSINYSTVRFQMYELGDSSVNNAIPDGEPNAGNLTGFTPWNDQVDGDPTTWGPSGTPLSPPQAIPADFVLNQTYDATTLEIIPQFGEFPENALCVVDLTFGIEDFGGSPLAPFQYSFTTQNLPEQTGSMRVEFNQVTEPWPQDSRTIDVDTQRSQGLAQAWMLFSGDGDNGSDPYTPSKPETPASDCTEDRQANDGAGDDFDPESDVTLDTGSTPNTCPNTVDGSTAVVWEFRSFRIRTGVTVRIVGVNPAILLVQGEVTIESGGVLRVRGDGSSGSPQGKGQTGYAWTSYATAIQKGGTGVAGGGNGGNAAQFGAADHGGDGWSAFGSEDGYTVESGEGAGEGGTNHDTIYPNSPGTAQGGGGGGHGTEGGTSTNVLGTGHTNQGSTRGEGGAAYPDTSAGVSMTTPSAGGGGGAGGNEEWAGSYAGVYSTGGGGGGAGGGFVDITSSGDINIFGTIDAAGSAGGNGGSTNYYAGPGGGGGGAGGGIRLITSANITLGGAAVLTTAGGAGGNSPNGSSGSGGPQNHGASGGTGRIVLEDENTSITGLNGGAKVTPGFGVDGFYVGQFDPTRFKGGGLNGAAVSGPMLVGPLSAVTFETPTEDDFKCNIPMPAAIQPDGASVLIEATGYPMMADGSPDTSSPERWYTIGYFSNSGSPSAPKWTAGANPPGFDVVNDGLGIHNLDGSFYLSFRLSFRLPDTVGPDTPGPWLDWMDFRLRYDQ